MLKGGLGTRLPYYSLQSYAEQVCKTSIQCYTVLYNVIQCYTMLYNVIQCYTVLYNVIQCYTMLYSVIQCYTVLSPLSRCGYVCPEHRVLWPPAEAKHLL